MIVRIITLHHGSTDIDHSSAAQLYGSKLFAYLLDLQIGTRSRMTRAIWLSSAV
jgi:hypothetical protein